MPPIETQQLRMLEHLRQAGTQPLTLDQLRAGGIDFPAVVIGELELSGYVIERVPRARQTSRRPTGRDRSLRSHQPPAGATDGGANIRDSHAGAQRRREVRDDGRMTTLRCQVGSARKPDRGAGALQPDLAVDPPERLRCLTTAVEEPGSEHPQEEGLANNPSADSARPDSARWSGARRAADLRALRQDRDADEERGEHRRRGDGRPRRGQQPPHCGGAFRCLPRWNE